MEDGGEVVVDGGVHGLGEADVGADGGAEEVEDPEGWGGVSEGVPYSGMGVVGGVVRGGSRDRGVGGESEAHEE